jgi:glycosyltransferase involved in cell wall biosynthesis
VSRQVPRKGIDVLLRALAQLDRAGASFRACIVGPGTLLKAHRRMVIELGLSGKVSMPGWVEDSFAYLREGDIFVLPSLEEGSGSVSVLEALQAGIAVIASACDGIPEDLTDGEDALLVPPGDVAALRQALARLLADESLRRQLAHRARSTYERRFSSAALVTALQTTYAELGFVP